MSAPTLDGRIQSAIDDAVSGAEERLGAELDSLADEVREARFAALDASTGSPPNHHALMHYAETVLAPYWRGEPPKATGSNIRQRRQAIDDEAFAEITGRPVPGPHLEIVAIDCEPEPDASELLADAFAEGLLAGMKSVGTGARP